MNDKTQPIIREEVASSQNILPNVIDHYTTTHPIIIAHDDNAPHTLEEESSATKEAIILRFFFLLLTKIAKQAKDEKKRQEILSAINVLVNKFFIAQDKAASMAKSIALSLGDPSVPIVFITSSLIIVEHLASLGYKGIKKKYNTANS